MNYVQYKEGFYNIMDNVVLNDFVERASDCPFDKTRLCVEDSQICEQIKKDADGYYYCEVASKVAELCKIASESRYLQIEEVCKDESCVDCEMKNCSLCLHDDEDEYGNSLSSYPKISYNSDYRALSRAD